jgi:hypothetical protein
MLDGEPVEVVVLSGGIIMIASIGLLNTTSVESDTVVAGLVVELSDREVRLFANTSTIWGATSFTTPTALEMMEEFLTGLTVVEFST